MKADSMPWRVTTLLAAGLLATSSVRAAGPTLQYLQVKPATASAGQTIEVIVTLSRRATTVIKLDSSDPKVVPIPPNYELAFDNQRTRSATFAALTPQLLSSTTTVTITASMGAGQKQATVTVTAATPTSPFQSATRTTYRITKGEMPDLLKLATERGFVFDASKVKGSRQNSCALRADRKGLTLEAVTRQPLPGGLWTLESVTCVFKILEGPLELKPEWTLERVSLTTEYDPERWSYLDPPHTGTRDPGFTIRILNEMPHSTPEYLLVLEQIELEGPGGMTWRDAF